MTSKLKKKAKKKTTKKASKVSDKSTASEAKTKDSALTGEEIANLELFNAEMMTARAEMSASEQLKKNYMLEKENLELKIQLIDNNIRKQSEFIEARDEKYRTLQKNLRTYAEKLKEKYEVDSEGFIKYDRLSGKIIK